MSLRERWHLRQWKHYRTLANELREGGFESPDIAQALRLAHSHRDLLNEYRRSPGKPPIDRPEDA